ncbi:DNA-binding transcription factor rap1 [Monosporozyma unispora]|nr:DNA-binding transcription factor rap1 [Kazachstania unispora]
MSDEQDFETPADTYNDHFVDALDTTLDPPSNGEQDENHSDTDNLGVNINDGPSTVPPETQIDEIESAIEENNKINSDNNEDDGETKIDMTENESDTTKKFWSGMKFYVNDAEDAHDNVNDAKTLIRLIKENGGEILDKLPELHDHSNSEGNTLVVSPYNDTNLVTVSPTFIKACVIAGILLNYQTYLVPYDKNRLSENESKEQQADGINDEAGNDSFDPNIDHNLVSDKDLAAAAAAAAIMDENKTSDNNETPSMGTFKQNGLNQLKPDTESELSMVDTSSNNTSAKQTPIPSSLSSHKNIFSEDEDDFILDVVRKNPTRRSTHTLYDEISKYMPNHTGNSIRHRFRGYLSKKLDHVYEVDKSGKLLRDERGNLIKTSVLPPSLKRKFTAAEDYGLAIAIKKQFYRDIYQVDPESGSSLILHNATASEIAKRNMTMDPNHEPGNEPAFPDFRTNGRRGPVAREFFKTYAEMIPTHTESAWRDRFRKFLLVYGIDAYIEYYDGCKAAKKEPEPLKNMTVRKKKRGEVAPGNYNSATKRSSILSEAAVNDIPSKRRQYMNSTESELTRHERNLISAVNNNISNVSGNGQNNIEVTLRDTNGVVLPTTIKKDGVINSTGVAVKDARKNNETTQRMTNEPHTVLDQHDINAPQHQQNVIDVNGEQSLNADNHPTSHPKSDVDFEREMLDEDTRKLISTLNHDLYKLDENNNNSLAFEYPADVAEAIREDYHMEEMSYDNIDPTTIQWPPKVASMELFLPKFFDLESTQDFMDKVNDVISRDYEPSDAETLVQNLANECGIRRNFCTAMLTSLSGDLMVIPRYFLNMFQSGINPPPYVPGVWTTQDDMMLRRNTDEDIKLLEKKHGAGRIEMRRRFIETALA